jgi:hypothetical protein
VRVPDDRKRREVGECPEGAALAEPAALSQPAQRVEHLGVDQVRGVGHGVTAQGALQGGAGGPIEQ